MTLAWAGAAASQRGKQEGQDAAAPSLIRPRDSRRRLCAALAPLLQEARVVARPRRKHALLPL